LLKKAAKATVNFPSANNCQINMASSDTDNDITSHFVNRFNALSVASGEC